MTRDRRRTKPVADRVFGVIYRDCHFYFSSAVHSAKFCYYVNHLPELPVSESLQRRFHLPGIRFEWLDIIQKYRQIETAGFLIVCNDGRTITCQDQLLFTDHVQIKK